MTLFDLISSIIGGMVIGGFCGSLSLVVGFAKNKKLIGICGFAFCIAFGTVMAAVLHKPAFLSLIPSALVVGLIFFLSKK